MISTPPNIYRAPFPEKGSKMLFEAYGSNDELDDINFANLTIATRTHPTAIQEYNHQIAALQVKIERDKRRFECLTACRAAVFEYEKNSGPDCVSARGIEGSSGASVTGKCSPGRRISQYILCSNTVNDVMNRYLMSGTSDYCGEVSDIEPGVAQDIENRNTQESSELPKECAPEIATNVQDILNERNSDGVVGGRDTAQEGSKSLDKASLTAISRVNDTEGTLCDNLGRLHLPILNPTEIPEETCPIALKKQKRRATAARWRKENPRKVQKSAAKSSYKRKALNRLFVSGETATSEAVNALVNAWMCEWEESHPE